MCTYTITSWLHVLLPISSVVQLKMWLWSGVTNNMAMICVYLQFAGSYMSQKKTLEASDTIPEALNFQILMSLVL